MKTLDQYRQMAQVVEVQYRQQQKSFQRLVAEEGRLRGALRQLDEHVRKSRTSDDASLRAIGADVVWQGWAGRKKQELNMQLAQVLAIKEHHIAQVRRAYGKVLAVQELCTQERAARKQRTAQTLLDRAVTSSLYR